jgi:hypothetical protein
MLSQSVAINSTRTFFWVEQHIDEGWQPGSPSVVAILSAVRRVEAGRMKAVSCLTWLLALLVVMASLDRLPDPPAARPDYAQSKSSGPHEQPADAAAPCPGLVVALHPLSNHGTVAISEPVPPRSQIVVLERASDTSPPAVPSQLPFLARI